MTTATFCAAQCIIEKARARAEAKLRSFKPGSPNYERVIDLIIRLQDARLEIEGVTRELEDIQ